MAKMSEATPAGQPRPTVDVVIPCYNEVTVLRASVEKTLALLAGHPAYSWRIVIADNGSNDGTGALASELEAEFPGRVAAVLLTVKGRGLPCARPGPEVPPISSATWTWTSARTWPTSRISSE